MEPTARTKILQLKAMIHELHEGAAPEQLKQRFAALLKEVSPAEIAQMEQ